MIINNSKNLLKEHNISSYALAKRVKVTPGNLKSIADNPNIVPRSKILEGVCRELKVNVNQVLIYVPSRINTGYNKSFKSSTLPQNYTSNEQYNILDVQRQLREQQEEMMIY